MNFNSAIGWLRGPLKGARRATARIQPRQVGRDVRPRNPRNPRNLQERNSMKADQTKARGRMPPYVLIVTITPEQEAAIRAEAAEAGADPARFLWEKIRNTPGVVVSP